MNKYALLAISIGLAIGIAYLIIHKQHDDTNSNDILKRVRKNFTLINPKYADIPLLVGDSAYTENKSVITLCLQDPKTHEFYDMNTLMYVALHELAHVINPKQGHGSEFRKKFQKLLNKGQQLGFYDPTIPMPRKYCGVKA